MYWSGPHDPHTQRRRKAAEARLQSYGQASRMTLFIYFLVGSARIVECACSDKMRDDASCA